MASIHPFLPCDAMFDPAALVSMGEAFDKACIALQCDADEPSLLKDVIAGQIIITAERGEHDPDRLCAAAMKAISVKR